MNANVVEKCCCERGYAKGAMLKSFSFDNFSIFGNLMKDSSIVIRYDGNLCNRKKKDQTTYPVIMYYVFDNDWINKKDVVMAKCERHQNTFCIDLDLDNHNTLTFGFYNSVGDFDTSFSESYNMKIKSNILNDIMERYETNSNGNLPAVKSNNSLSVFGSITSKLKNLFGFHFNNID